VTLRETIRRRHGGVPELVELVRFCRTRQAG